MEVGITDHDTLEGHEEALIAGTAIKVEVFPGVEVSAKDERLGKVHVLGLWISNGDTDLRRSLEEIVRGKKKRNEKIIDHKYKLLINELFL